jgi:hypothetical protein
MKKVAHLILLEAFGILSCGTRVTAKSLKPVLVLGNPLIFCIISKVGINFVTSKNDVFWDVTLCGSSKNQRFRGMYRLHHQDDKNRLARNKAVISN